MLDTLKTLADAEFFDFTHNLSFTFNSRRGVASLV